MPRRPCSPKCAFTSHSSVCQATGVCDCAARNWNGEARGSEGAKSTENAQLVIRLPTFVSGEKVPPLCREETRGRQADNRGSLQPFWGQLVPLLLRPRRGSYAGPVDTDAQGGRLPSGARSEEAVFTGELGCMSKSERVFYFHLLTATHATLLLTGLWRCRFSLSE